MKKYLKLSLLTFLFVSLLILLGTKNVNAAIARANVSYGEITDEGVTVTVTFASDMTGSNYDNPEKNIYWTQSGNTYTTILEPGSYYYMFKDNGNNSIESAIIAVPIEITVGTELTLPDTLSEISVEDTSIASLNGNVIKGLKAGETTYSATAEIEGSTVDFTWELTVVDDSSEEEPDGLEWTDFSNVTFEWEESNSSHESLSNTLLIKNDKIINNHYYYFYCSADDTDPNIKTGTNNRIAFDEVQPGSSSILALSTDTNISNRLFLAKFLELNNSDLYVTIVEEQLDESNKYIHKIIKRVHVGRPTELKLGTRTKFYFFDTDTSSILYYPTLSTSERKFNLKIGKVTDTTILKNIKNGTSDCLQQLMDYAKADSSPVYTGTVPLGISGTITSDFNLIDDAYYYVYSELEDEEGKYYPVEDISLFQAMVSNAVGANLFDYLDDDFKWNLPEEAPTTDAESEEKPPVLPDAGSKSFIILAVFLVGITTFTFIKLRKFKNI